VNVPKICCSGSNPAAINFFRSMHCFHACFRMI
jgi:hypothetical protein